MKACGSVWDPHRLRSRPRLSRRSLRSRRGRQQIRRLHRMIRLTLLHSRSSLPVPCKPTGPFCSYFYRFLHFCSYFYRFLPFLRCFYRFGSFLLPFSDCIRFRVCVSCFKPSSRCVPHTPKRSSVPHSDALDRDGFGGSCTVVRPFLTLFLPGVSGIRFYPCFYLGNSFLPLFLPGNSFLSLFLPGEFVFILVFTWGIRFYPCFYLGNSFLILFLFWEFVFILIFISAVDHHASIIDQGLLPGVR